MLRTCMLVVGLLIWASWGLLAQPAGTVYELHLRYEGVQMMELVPGVEVPSDMWDDDHVMGAFDYWDIGDVPGALVLSARLSLGGTPVIRLRRAVVTVPLAS